MEGVVLQADPGPGVAAYLMLFTFIAVALGFVSAASFEGIKFVYKRVVIE